MSVRRLKASARVVLSSPTGVAAALLGVAFLALALVGPAIWGEEAMKIAPAHAFAGPSSDALLGTDGLGRDVLARTLAATRLSLELALGATAIAVVLGVPLGASVALVGPRAQRAIGTAIGFGLALPGMLVALVIVTVASPGSASATVAIGVALAPAFARTAQTLAAAIAESDYLAAARVLGVGRRRLLLRHVLPNTAEPLLLQIGVAGSLALVLISGLSFLGLGVQAPSYDWGRVLNEGVDALYTTPSAAVGPGVAIVLAGLMFTFIGEALARATSPLLRVEAAERRRDRGRASTPAAAPAPAPALAPADDAAPATVRVEDLRVAFSRDGELHEAVAGVSFEIGPGEIVGVVGESGSGKSMTALAVAGLLPASARMRAGRLEFRGTELARLSRRERTRLLATDLAVIFQDPMSTLNPALRVGRQLTEKVEVHAGMGRREALALAEQRLAQTGIADAARRLRDYPHEFSGGMRQRAMIAMGLMTDPALIVADEPTTALDVTVQAQILDLLREINARSGTAILFISHDLAVVSELCSRVLVMYAGRIVETLDTAALDRASHPYTRALLETVVDLDSDPAQPLVTIPGQPPALERPLAGCPFAPRCAEAVDRCGSEAPALAPLGEPGHLVACWARATEPRPPADTAATTEAVCE